MSYIKSVGEGTNTLMCNIKIAGEELEKGTTEAVPLPLTLLV